MASLRTEREIAGAAAGIIGESQVLTAVERCLVADAPSCSSSVVESCWRLIEAGEDPLGEALLAIRSPATRREMGAVYTPPAIVQGMVGWAVKQGTPARVVDPGAGSGRFITAAAEAFPDASLVACEIDPLASLILRANSVAKGFSSRLDVKLVDYRRLALDRIEGRTLFIGNPPYVRHHGIDEDSKRWFAQTAARFGFSASKLAGLHIHFFLRTRELGQPHDFGSFVTSAEWMDVNYGSLLRQMLADGLGGHSLQVFRPDQMPFGTAMTTGVITSFKIGNRANSFTVREISDSKELEDLSAGRELAWEDVISEDRWSRLVKPQAPTDSDLVPLGELFRVHRGTVTGHNKVFVAGEYDGPLPSRFLLPTVTKAKDLLTAGRTLTAEATRQLKRVIDIPTDLAALSVKERSQVDAFLIWAKSKGADKSFTARSRRSWWSVGLREPAPILCTYMARRAPAFVRNPASARFINIAHGIYPRQPMSDADLDAYAFYLAQAVTVAEGRTYAGGLTKFEPKEIERIRVPCLDSIHGYLPEKMDTSTDRRGRAEGEGRFSR